MSWLSRIGAKGATSEAYTEYARERIASHTKVCISLLSSVEQVRQAQAAIAELELLARLPASAAADISGPRQN